jgi:hypothetical protein
MLLAIPCFFFCRCAGPCPLDDPSLKDPAVNISSAVAINTIVLPQINYRIQLNGTDGIIRLLNAYKQTVVYFYFSNGATDTVTFYIPKQVNYATVNCTGNAFYLTYGTPSVTSSTLSDYSFANLQLTINKP